ncbi:hypothetical protein IQ07DRAFT_93484 [Pyrenochaeta sp. DS3sAY3a]|nr:hypothetical protein IQ07DRAFT_93484 [Pyrenochaeta sp. DS3sAY3a]
MCIVLFALMFPGSRTICRTEKSAEKSAATVSDCLLLAWDTSVNRVLGPSSCMWLVGVLLSHPRWLASYMGQRLHWRTNPR